MLFVVVGTFRLEAEDETRRRIVVGAKPWTIRGEIDARNGDGSGKSSNTKTTGNITAKRYDILNMFLKFPVTRICIYVSLNGVCVNVQIS